MKKLFLSALCLASIAGAANAETARWLRDVAVSPNGSTIAFTYKGDIFTIPYGGGRVHQLTTSRAYDSAPVWSPDGSKIAFRSNRDGSDDIFIVDAFGGMPKKITTHSGQETPIAFKDNNHLIFTASMDADMETSRGPWLTQTYIVDVTKENPRPELYLALPMTAASVNNNGDMLYSDKKGFEDVFRKHERSSGTSDIWLYSGKDFRKLTDFIGHDVNPVWKKGTDTFFYVTEEDGTLNVFEASTGGKERKQLTKFQKHPVRSLSASDAGMLAFSWDGDIYTLTPGSEPVKLNVEIAADLYDSDRVKNYSKSGASSMAVSPSGNEVAFVIRGEVYVTDSKYKTTKRITNTPAQERVMSFSPDGKQLVYDSDRDGYWQLYIAKIKNPDEKQFAYATDIEEELLYKSPTSAQQPAFSPDGKKVAFLENRTELKVIDVKTKKVTTALDGKYNYSYSDGDISFEWSPDSKWLLVNYIGEGGWHNSDIAMVKADGTEVIDLTESGYSDDAPRWAMGGNAITYVTGKYGMKSHGSWGNQSDIVLMALNQDAWDNFSLTQEELDLKEKAEKEAKEKADKEKKESADKNKKGKADAKKDEKKAESKSIEFDLKDRKHRSKVITPNSAFISDYFLSPKGDKLYYLAAATEGGSNLLVHDLKKDETKVLTKNVRGRLEPDAKGENLFLLSRGSLKKINLAKGDIENIEFEADYDRKPSLEREYMFDHMVRQVNDKFYDENLHGVDWEGYAEHYREFLPYITNNRDFAILLSEILGELNASHTGGRAPSGTPMFNTAELGAIYDKNYKGDGLKIAELLPASPLSAKKGGVKPGDIILAIDGEKILAGKDYYPLLEGKAGKKVRIEIQKANGGKETIDVKPISRGEFTSMMYNRWVERNQAIVDSLSGGRLAYVHIQGMNSPSFRTVYDQLLGKYRNREAVIVDTRFNGGGWLHNDIAVLLNGKEYVRFSPRGHFIGHEPFSQWTKPSVMLINESNYSDAHGTPYTYKTLGIGELIGAPVPGTMTAVWWENQIDPSIIFGIPQVTSLDINGKPLENQQLNPDILIYNNPANEIKGIDDQLEGAVRHLLNKLDKK